MKTNEELQKCCEEILKENMMDFKEIANRLKLCYPAMLFSHDDLSKALEESPNIELVGKSFWVLKTTDAPAHVPCEQIHQKVEQAFDKVCDTYTRLYRQCLEVDRNKLPARNHTFFLSRVLQPRRTATRGCHDFSRPPIPFRFWKNQKGGGFRYYRPLLPCHNLRLRRANRIAKTMGEV